MTTTKPALARCVSAIARIDSYLQAEQRDARYDQWLERYLKAPAAHDDRFIFGKLVQAMFSGGMKGQVVDQWMPSMEQAFHAWDLQRIATMTERDLDALIDNREVIAHRPKLRAVLVNAKHALAQITRFGSLAAYLTSFPTLAATAAAVSARFSFLGEVTAEDFLRNIGFDTVKPDRHLTRWLGRMGAVSADTTPAAVIAVVDEIARASSWSRARIDTVIYLYCAERDDVLPGGGICGVQPRCAACPVAELCPARQETASIPPAEMKPNAARPNTRPRSSPAAVKHPSDSISAMKYPGLTLDAVRVTNPFATPSWLDQPLGHKGSWERLGDIDKLFAGHNEIGRERISELGVNKGKYVAFRAIAHGHARWESGVLRRIRVE